MTSSSFRVKQGEIKYPAAIWRQKHFKKIRKIITKIKISSLNSYIHSANAKILLKCQLIYYARDIKGGKKRKERKRLM